MSEEEQLKLFATDGMIVKRSLVIGKDFVLVGFKESEWEKVIVLIPQIYVVVVNIMDFTIELIKCNDVCFDFYDDECHPVNLLDGEPYRISGEIRADNGQQIGNFLLYELDNDYSFWDKCDTISGDSEVIASAICGKRGKVLKNYIPDISDFDTILILDKIEIKKEFRKNGIGSSVMKKLVYMMHYQFGSGKAIFLCASDYESAGKYGFDSEEYKKGTRNLVEFYKKLGFEIVKNNVMVYCE